MLHHVEKPDFCLLFCCSLYGESRGSDDVRLKIGDFRSQIEMLRPEIRIADLQSRTILFQKNLDHRHNHIRLPHRQGKDERVFFLFIQRAIADFFNKLDLRGIVEQLRVFHLTGAAIQMQRLERPFHDVDVQAIQLWIVGEKTVLRNFELFRRGSAFIN